MHRKTTTTTVHSSTAALESYSTVTRTETESRQSPDQVQGPNRVQAESRPGSDSQRVQTCSRPAALVPQNQTQTLFNHENQCFPTRGARTSAVGQVVSGRWSQGRRSEGGQVVTAVG
ncbi:hypothetical protein WMY93_034398, partial [Mugilogobius chulae]